MRLDAKMLKPFSPWPLIVAAALGIAASTPYGEKLAGLFSNFKPSFLSVQTKPEAIPLPPRYISPDPIENMRTLSMDDRVRDASRVTPPLYPRLKFESSSANSDWTPLAVFLISLVFSLVAKNYRRIFLAFTKLRLTSGQRNVPRNRESFSLPGRGRFSMPDKMHADAADAHDPVRVALRKAAENDPIVTLLPSLDPSVSRQTAIALAETLNDPLYGSTSSSRRLP